MNFEPTPVCDIREIEDKTKDSRWIFRGQRKTFWPLVTSLERVCVAFEAEISKHGAKIEQMLLREFQRRFHHYRSHVPADILEWLSYMQHFGAPTRLLDWTYSFHVALYFAIEVPDPHGYAVWAIDQKWLQERSLEKIKASHHYITEIESRESIERFLSGVPMEQDSAWFGKLLFDLSAPRLVFCANPFRLNERLTLQKGLFLALGDANASFEENLGALEGYKEHIRKFTVHPGKRLSLLRFLDRLNINCATLFPGLEGFSRSLSVFHHRTSELS